MGEYSRTENGQNGETDWDLRSILRDLAKSGWVILLIACSAAMVTYTVLTVCHRDRYTVKTTFAVMGRGENASAASSLAATYDMTQKFEAILENSILKKKVTEELKLSSFPAKMSASIVPESNLMELSVTADSPQTAFRILKSVLENYTSVSDYIIPAVVLETLQQPQVTGIPSNEIPKERYAVTAFLATALATAGMVVLLSWMRDTVKNESEFTRKVDADLLGVVCHERKRKNSSMLITNPARSFSYVESLRHAASRVRGRLDQKNGKVLLVTSVAENEGKSTLAANLALSMAEEQNRVLLLDCDFRQPALYKIFEIPEKDGKDFGKVITGKEPAAGVFEKYRDTNVYTGLCRARLLDPSEAIGGEIFRRILETCRTNMDYIILDTPPMGIAADAEEMAEFADAAVLAVRQDSVLTRDINDAIDALNQKEEKVIGCVFGNVYPGFGERIGGSYGYGYGYGTYSRAER
ncbi:tyrosine-protein kinase domain-containing protein [Fusicatenibacter sp.]